VHVLKAGGLYGVLPHVAQSSLRMQCWPRDNARVSVGERR